MAALKHRVHITNAANYRTRTGLLILLITSFLTQSRAQEISSAQPAMFVRANDRFAKHTQNHMRLLRNLTRPLRNICNPENPNNFGFPPHFFTGEEDLCPRTLLTE
jgi:hypothetical protein